MAVQIENIPTIRVEGLSLSDYTVMDIALEKGLLYPSSMVFTMRRKSLLRNDGDIYFDIAGSLLGSKVSLSMTTLRRDENMNEKGDTLTFSGIVFGVRNSRDVMGNVAYIQVTAYSPDYLLVDNPHCASFEDKTLSEIINEVIGDNGKLINTDLCPIQTARLPYTVQYNETSYQFISRLAQRFGEYLYFDSGKFHFGRAPQGKNIVLYPDIDVLGYSYQLGMEHTDFHHAQHDYLKYKNTSSDAYTLASGRMHELTDMVYEHSHSAYKKPTMQDMHSTSQEYSTFSQNEMSATAEGYGAKARMMTCNIRTNRADLCIGDKITIGEMTDEGGLSSTEHQELMAVGVKYHFSADGHFENEVTAIPSVSPYAPYGIEDLYPVCESQRAQVVDNNDPEHLGRIRVQFLWQQLQPGLCATPWLRIAQPHGGDDKGFYFIPEIGEEVMVAFENGNGEKPYVVGTLYHGKQQPGRKWPHDQNNIKAIRTRNGHTVEIYDEGDGGYIKIYDYQKENYILTYSTDEKLIKLESTGNIELYAKNDIIMRAGHDISVYAGNDEAVFVGNNRNTEVQSNDVTNIGNDQNLVVGNNRDTSISNNNTIQIGGDKIIDINGNKDERIVNNNYLSAREYVEEIENEVTVSANAQQYKSSVSTKIDGGTQVDIKANMTRVN